MHFIDLHVHLDGSIPLHTARELAARQGLPLYDEAELRRRMVAPPDCRDLNEYLAVFDYPLSLIQTEEAIEYAVYAFLKTLSDQGLTAAEPRFATSLLTRGGLNQQQALEAALRGRARFLSSPDNVSGLEASFILCTMRGPRETNEKANFETLELAKAYLGKGVCAADLAGAEALFPTTDYRSLFARAAELGLPYTIHAGEAAGPESIRAALSFGARRIGHGVRCLEDPALVQELAKAQIPLELCPTSNLHTRIFAKMEDYPIRPLLEAGVCITINTDNMTVSDTTLAREFSRITEALQLSEAELSVLEQNAEKARFARE